MGTGRLRLPTVSLALFLASPARSRQQAKLFDNLTEQL
jgi:hypothetical protein